MSEVAKELCRRVMVKHAIPDPDGRVLAAMQDVFAQARELGGYGWQPDQHGEMVSCDPAPHAARMPVITGKTYKL